GPGPGAPARPVPPADGAAQAQGRGALRLHRQGEGKSLLPPLREALPRLREGGPRARPGARAPPRPPRALRPGARMIAMVLAAGLGTRLRPLTERIPKPALPLLGSTLLEENLALVARLGVREVVVN